MDFVDGNRTVANLLIQAFSRSAPGTLHPFQNLLTAKGVEEKLVLIRPFFIQLLHHRMRLALNSRASRPDNPPPNTLSLAVRAEASEPACRRCTVGPAKFADDILRFV